MATDPYIHTGRESHFGSFLPSTKGGKRRVTVVIILMLLAGFYGYLFYYVESVYATHVPEQYLNTDPLHPWVEDLRYQVEGYDKVTLDVPAYIPLSIRLEAYSKETPESILDKPYDGAFAVTTIKTFTYIDPDFIRTYLIEFLNGPFFGINLSDEPLGEDTISIQDGNEATVLYFYGIQERQEGYFVQNAIFRVNAFYGHCPGEGTNFAGMGIALVDAGTVADDFSVGMNILSDFVHRNTYDESTYNELNGTMIPNLKCEE